LHQDSLAQFSADPAIELSKAAIPTTDTNGQPKSMRLRTEGPIGHSADRASARKRFNAASFIVPVPDLGVSDRLWPMGQIRMRRRLVPAAFTTGTGSTSEWTPPYWVQWIPPVERIDEINSKLAKRDGRRIKAVAGNPNVIELEITALDGTISPFVPPTDRGGLFRYALLMSEEIRDVAGRVRERYAGIAVPSAPPERWQTMLEPSANRANAIARVLEIQVTDQSAVAELHKSAECFWAALFPNVDGPSLDLDARARVVGMSRPYFARARSTT
jgi:hypothetical protein